MRFGGLAISLVGLLAVACQAAGEPAESVPGSSAATSTAVTTTTLLEVDPHLVFEAVDMGTASSVKFLDPEPLMTMQQTEFDPAGDSFELIGCRATWFGNYEFEFEWAPGPTGDPKSTRQIVVSLAVGDTGVLGAFFEVELSEPGRFVVPLLAFDPFWNGDNSSGRTERGANSPILDDAASVSCIAMYFGTPVVEPATPMTPMTVEIKAPLPLHPTDTLQGVIEGMDPNDEETPLRPLAALAGVMPEFPLDVVYVIPGERMTTASFETDGACLSMTSKYGEAGIVTQHAGCFNGRFGGTPVDDDWTAEITGDFAVEDLKPLPWVGHPGTQIPRTAEEYLDQRNLPESSTEVFRTEVDGILVSIIRYQSDDGGTVSYSLEGLGDNSGGGGFPGEVWAGCYQVEWKETGYSMVVVGDPDWTLEVRNQPIELTEADGVGIAVVPVPIRQREQLRIETETGEVPACVD
jgi:hypothetical protein